jgi:hypothetical protein
MTILDWVADEGEAAEEAVVIWLETISYLYEIPFNELLDALTQAS